MKTFMLRGVPNSVQMDGWWMSEPPKPTPRKRGASEPMLPRVVALVALILAGDALTWRAEPGLSLALFGMFVLLALWLLCGRRGAGGLVLAGFMFLPLLEQAQAISLGFFFFGMVFGAAWIGLGGRVGVFALVTAALRFLGAAPSESAIEWRRLSFVGVGLATQHASRDVLRSWILPVGLGLVFAALLASANPMLEGFVLGMGDMRLADQLGLRLFFWTGLAVFVMPFLLAMRMRERMKLRFVAREVALPAVFNADAICRSLLIFNAMFAVQTGLDLIYLWGGAGLPDGMSHAEYVHRGAYPLLVTALLAGVFAVMARPFTDGSKLLRAALLAWIVQNVFLVVSSLYRLDLYVSAYGLTHLRLAAAIWMGVVAVGLVLVIWQVLRQKPAGWLLGREALLGVMALYLASFVSFSTTVARYNLSHDVPLDRAQICALGPHAMPVIMAYEAEHGQICHGPRLAQLEFGDWREWGFRDWRLQRSLAQLTAEEAL